MKKSESKKSRDTVPLSNPYLTSANPLYLWKGRVVALASFYFSRSRISPRSVASQNLSSSFTCFLLVERVALLAREALGLLGRRLVSRSSLSKDY